MKSLKPFTISTENSKIRGTKYSTSDFPVNQRKDWLCDFLDQEYAHVNITPPTEGDLFNEMILCPWGKLRLSSIRSNMAKLQGLPREPELATKDAYFALVHLSGNFLIQQNGKEVYLKPGDICLSDATIPRILSSSKGFSMLIVSIPRPLLRERISGVEHCTALRIPGSTGIGSVASNFIQSCANQANQLNDREFSDLSEYSLDLLTLALASVRPEKFNLSSSRFIMLNRVKTFIEQHLSDSEMNPTMVSSAVGISPRYINMLFKEEDTSLMRYIWQRRLENCRKDMLDPAHIGHRVTDIAFRWGFKDLSHFNRLFKKQFGFPPKDYRQQNK